MRVNPENGLLYLLLIKSTHLVKAYKKTQEIVVSKCIMEAVNNYIKLRRW